MLHIQILDTPSNTWETSNICCTSRDGAYSIAQALFHASLRGVRILDAKGRVIWLLKRLR